MQINDFDKVHVQHHHLYASKDIEWSTADDPELRDKSFTIVLGKTDHERSPSWQKQFPSKKDGWYMEYWFK